MEDRLRQLRLRDSGISTWAGAAPGLTGDAIVGGGRAATVNTIRDHTSSAIKLTIGITATLATFTAACTSGTPETTDGQSTGRLTTTSVADQGPTVTIPQVTSSALAGGCDVVTIESPGNIQRADLNETSGLAISTTHQDTVWAVNDSGNASGVHALDFSGTDRGFYPLRHLGGVPVTTTDVEDMALYDGMLYLADIGDNNAVRDTVTVFLTFEPSPGSDEFTWVQQLISIRYPTGPVDAEAFLVDPLTGQLVILDKDLSGTETTIFTVDPPFVDSSVGGPPMEAIAAGTFDLGLLESTNMELTAAALLFPAAVTAADITADGSLIAVRTYGTVWFFSRAAGQTVADALAGTPCEPGGAREGQGESLAFLPDSDPNGNQVRFLTVSEGDFRPLNIATVDGQR